VKADAEEAGREEKHTKEVITFLELRIPSTQQEHVSSHLLSTINYPSG